MNWTIDPTVQINGTNYTSDTLNGVSIKYGRTTIWEQPRAGYAQIQILNDNNSPISIQLNDPVTISVDNSLGVPQAVFTGKVQSISNSVQALGAIGKVVIHTVTAISPMADMSRVITHTSSFPKEYDDVRLDRIITASGVTIDVIDSPGVYQFTASTARAADCYYWASFYAQMAFGYIYDTTDGKIGYANESRRTVEAATNGYLTIPEDVILYRGVNSEINLNNLLNKVRLEYKANAIVTSQSTSSITSYGEQAADILTELEDATQAQNQADRYITLRSTPQTVLRSFTVQLSNPSITSSVLDGMLGMYMGKPVQVHPFPEGIYSGVFKGFVEGWNLTISQNSASINLNVTKNTLSLAPTRWQDVLATLQWEDVTPTLEWADYEQESKLALSPNYGWVEPDDSDFVKDGALAMRDLGDDADATVYKIENSKGRIVHPFLLMGA